jgi:DNA-binding protein HU-beta
MVKADIVNRVAETAKLRRALAVKAVDVMIEALRNAIVEGERIEFRGFGVFQVRPRKRGIGRNPRTGLEVKIPPGRTVRFKPGKDLRNITL